MGPKRRICAITSALALAAALGACSDSDESASAGAGHGGASGGDASGTHDDSGGDGSNAPEGSAGDGSIAPDASAGNAGADADAPATPLAYDIAVVGAGPGGVAAAIAAARSASKVVLLEETDWIGGQMTAAAVSTMDGGNAPPSLSGLYADFRQRVIAYYADAARFPPSGKSVSTCYWSSATTCFEPFVGRLILQQMLAQAGVDVMLEERVSGVSKSGEVVTGLSTASGKRFAAKVVVDATETGDVIALSGARYRAGNSVSDALNINACIQSLTYVAVIKKYPGGVPPELSIQSQPPGYTTFLPEYQSVVTKDGSSGAPIVYPVSVPFHAAYRGLPDSTNPVSYVGTDYASITKTGVNWANDYPGYAVVDGGAQWSDTLRVSYLEDPTVRRSVNCQAKLATLGFIYYLQHDLGEADWSLSTDEGYDSAFNQSQHCAEIPTELAALERQMPPMPYVREARRIVAVTTLGAKDMQKSDGIAVKGQPSSIAVGDYGTDLHNCATDPTLENYLGETSADHAGGGSFQVPLETLLPEQLDGLLAAEKNIGATRLAAGAIREQPITMSTGEAAGALAALASKKGIAPRAVRIADVQRELLAHQHALSRFWYADVPLSNPDWAAVQLVSTHEVMIGVSSTQFDLTSSLTRRQAAVVFGRLFGLDVSNPPATPTFGDVPATDPAYGFVEAFATAGFTAGCSSQPKMFCPDDPTTRGQLAVFVVKGLGLDPGTAPTIPLFDDIATSPLFAFIQLAAQAGIIEGCSTNPNRFCPDDPTSRSTAAHVGYELLVR